MGIPETGSGALFRLFLILGCVVVLALFFALLAPYFLPWADYRADFEREASRLTGHKVVVRGKADAKIIPFPTVTFTDVLVENSQTGETMLEVERFSMDAELAPFLTGEVRITNITMERPLFRFTIEPDGTLDWSKRANLLVDLDKVQIDLLQIKNGTIEAYGLIGGETTRITDLTAALNAKSLYGPWRLDGSAQIEGRQTDIKISTGRLQNGGHIRTKIVATLPDQPYRLNLDGPLALNGTVGYSGEFRFGPRPASDPVSATSAGREALPVRAEGAFSALPDEIKIDGFRLEAGDAADPYTLNGSGNIMLAGKPSFRIIAKGRQIDLGRLRAAKAAVAKPRTIKDRIADLMTVLERVPIPQMDGMIDLQLPAIVSGDTVIREINTRFSPAGAEWRIHELSAGLPGNSTVGADGQLRLKDGFSFHGRAALTTRQPSGFAAWATGHVDPSIRRLNHAALSADVVLSQNQTRFYELKADLGGQKLSGEVQRLPAAPQGRPALVTTLHGDAIDLDILRAVASLAIGDAKNDTSDTHDIDVTLVAGSVTASGLQAEGVKARMRIENGDISIKQLDLDDFYGAEITTSGGISDILDKPDGNLKINLKAADTSRLAKTFRRFVGENRFVDHINANPNLFDGMELDVDIVASAKDGGSDGLIVLAGNIGGTKLWVSLDFDGRFDELQKIKIDLNSTFENEDAIRLLEQFTLPVVPVPLGGPLSVSFDLNGVLSQMATIALRADTPGTDLNISGEINTQGDDRLKTKLDLVVTSQDIEPLAFALGAGLPGMGGGTSFTSLSQISTLGWQIAINSITGQFNGANYSGTANFDWPEIGLATINADLTSEYVSLPFLASLYLGPNVYDAGRPGNWSTREFSDPILPPFEATAILSAGQLYLADALELTEVTTGLEMTPGGVRLVGLEGRSGTATAAGDLGLGNTQGTATFYASMTLKGLDANAVMEKFAGTDHGGAIEGTVDLQLNAKGNGKSLRNISSSLGGGGVARIREGTIAKLDPDALDGIIRGADQHEFEVTEASVTKLVEGNLHQNIFSFGDHDLPFTIAGGKLRTGANSLSSAGTSFRHNFNYSITDNAIDLDSTITFSPGKKDRIPGGIAELGLSANGALSQPEITVSVQPMVNYLAARALDREQRRVESLQAKVSEAQRLQREIFDQQARNAYLSRLEAERLRQEQIRIERELELIRNNEARIRNYRELLLRKEAPPEPEPVPEPPLPDTDQTAAIDDTPIAQAASAPNEPTEQPADEQQEIVPAIRLDLLESIRKIMDLSR